MERDSEQLVQESLHTDLILAASAGAAIAAMTDHRPDVILTSTILAANDEQDLIAHLRATPSLRHLPVLTIPPVAELPATETRSNGLFSRLLRRRRPEPWPMYDFSAVITRIEEAIEQSKLAAARADEVEKEKEETAVAPIVERPDSVLLSSGSHRRAPRWSLSDLPWLSSVRLPWGQHLHLLNISSSGMLVESGVRLAPGSETSFKIGGPGLDLVVRGRVIRSRVAKVDSLGVKYETAAAFDQPVEVLKAPEEAPADSATQLAELVATIEAHAERGTSPAALRAEFEAGVLELIMAREVRLRDVPVVENDGRESVYFTITDIRCVPGRPSGDVQRERPAIC